MDADVTFQKEDGDDEKEPKINKIITKRKSEGKTAEKESLIVLDKEYDNTYTLYRQSKPISRVHNLVNPEGTRCVAIVPERTPWDENFIIEDGKIKIIEHNVGEVYDVMKGMNYKKMVRTVGELQDVIVDRSIKKKKKKKVDPDADASSLKKKKKKANADVEEVYVQRNKTAQGVGFTLMCKPLVFFLPGKEEVMLIYGPFDSLGDVLNELEENNMETGLIKCKCIGCTVGVCDTYVVKTAAVDDEEAVDEIFEKRDEICMEIEVVKMKCQGKTFAQKVQLFGRRDPTLGGHKVRFEMHDNRFDVRVYGALPDSDHVQMYDTWHAGAAFKAHYGRSVDILCNDEGGKLKDLDLRKVYIPYKPSGSDIVFVLNTRIHEDGKNIVSDCKKHLWKLVPSHFSSPVEYAFAVQWESALRELHSLTA